MQKSVLLLTTSAFILACGLTTARAQQPTQQQTQEQPAGDEGRGMMGHEGMMGGGMMGHEGMMGRGMMERGGMMGRGMMAPPVMMRIIFSLMDSDGDGTVSLQEFQAAHERIFKGMDANKDGVLTLEEIQAFMRGTRR